MRFGGLLIVLALSGAALAKEPMLSSPSMVVSDRSQSGREISFNRVPIALWDKSWLNRTIHEVISIPARWRLDHDFYKFPVELWAKDLVNQVISPPKPKVDAKRLSPEPVTC